MMKIDLGALKDGTWYSLIRKHPRLHYYAKWDAQSEVFWWAESRVEIGMSHCIEVSLVDEILHDLPDPPEGEHWV